MAKFRKAVAKDIKHRQTMNHSPSKKDMDRLIDQNINELINFATENHESVSTLLSRNGDANFPYRIIEYSTRMIEQAIIYYYSLYHQERLLSKKNTKLQFISRQYALAFLEPLLIWQHHSDQMTVRDIKSMISWMWWSHHMNFQRMVCKNWIILKKPRNRNDCEAFL